MSNPGSSSPKKNRRVKHPKTNIKTEELKSKGYREQTIANEPVQLDWKANYHADHILEPQTVAYFLNNHRNNKKVNPQCAEALKGHLNQPENLKMLHKDDNSNKNHVVGALNEHRFPDKKFTPSVATYIVANKQKIRTTATQLDKELRRNPHCKDIKSSRHDNIKRAAQRMIDHAVRQ